MVEDQLLPRDEAVWNEEMEKVEASPAAIAKKIFIITKTAFILFQTLKAANAWRKSSKKMAMPATLVLLMSAVIVASIAAYKFTSKRILPLATLQACSHYLCLCVLHVLVGYADAKKFEKRTAILRGFKLFHVIYWVIIGVAATKTSCTEENFYPDTLMLNDCFFLGIYLMTYMLHARDYTIKWGPDEEESKKLFTKQTERLLSCFTLLIEIHMLQLVLGKGLDSFTDSVMCAENGTKWIYASAKGNLFTMLHIIGTAMGTGMARAVFIKTAKAEGFFDGIDDADSEDEGATKVADADTKKKDKSAPAAKTEGKKNK